MVHEVLSRLVRWYLRNVPVTEGKRLLLSITEPLIIPNDPNQVSAMKYGFSLRLNLKNKEHLRMWLYGEHDERYEIRIVEKIIKKGDICLDIGANIGFYTCYFAALVGDKGKIVAFEPAAQTFKRLSENVKMNGFSNVKLINKGMGLGEMEAFLNYNESSFCEGTASIKFTDGRSIQERVKLSSLDRLLADGELSKPDFVKIDVEGFQREVFLGGKDFFQDNGPIIMVELKENDKEEMGGVEEIIRNYGFSIYEIQKHGLKECHDTVKAGKRNFILAKKSSHHYERLTGFILK